MKNRKLLIGLALGAVIVATIQAVGRSDQSETVFNDLTVKTLSLSYANVHLVKGPNGAFLVDSGNPGDGPKIEEALEIAGLKPSALRAIILTHGHHDHAGTAKYFQSKHGIIIVAGTGDLPLLRSGRNDLLCPTSQIAKFRLKKDQAGVFEPVIPDILVSGEMQLKSVTGVSGKIIQLPGHTPGSLVVSTGDLAFTGDLLRGSIIGKKATTHFYMCDLSRNKRDIGVLLNSIAPRAKTFFAGHFGPLQRSSVEKLASAVERG